MKRNIQSQTLLISDQRKMAADFELAKSGRMTSWKRQVEEHTNQIGLKKEDAIDKTKWRDAVYKLSRDMR